MPVKAILTNKDGHTLHNERVQSYKELSPENDVTLVTMNPFLVHGVFKAVTIAGAGTTIIAAPKAGGSLFITDVVVSAKRVNNTTLIVAFSDGTNIEGLIAPDTNQSPVNFSWSPNGRIQGWIDAAVVVISTGVTDATVTIGYSRNPESDSYIDWQGQQ